MASNDTTPAESSDHIFTDECLQAMNLASDPAIPIIIYPLVLVSILGLATLIPAFLLSAKHLVCINFSLRWLTVFICAVSTSYNFVVIAINLWLEYHFRFKTDCEIMVTDSMCSAFKLVQYFCFASLALTQLCMTFEHFLTTGCKIRCAHKIEVLKVIAYIGSIILTASGMTFSVFYDTFSFQLDHKISYCNLTTEKRREMVQINYWILFSINCISVVGLCGLQVFKNKIFSHSTDTAYSLRARYYLFSDVRSLTIAYRIVSGTFVANFITQFFNNILRAVIEIPTSAMSSAFFVLVNSLPVLHAPIIAYVLFTAVKKQQLAIRSAVNTHRGESARQTYFEQFERHW